MQKEANRLRKNCYPLASRVIHWGVNMESLSLNGIMLNCFMAEKFKKNLFFSKECYNINIKCDEKS